MPQQLTENSAEHIENTLQRAEKHCQKHGSKLTKKRKLILSTLLSVEKAISAYELIDLFKKQFNLNIPPMSVYRILDYLVGLHLVHKIHIANKFVACSKIGCQENHDLAHLLFCQQCQRVQEVLISSSIYSSFTNEIKNLGNELCTQHIELACICSLCSDNSISLQQSQSLYNQG